MDKMSLEELMSSDVEEESILPLSGSNKDAAVETQPEELIPPISNSIVRSGTDSGGEPHETGKERLSVILLHSIALCNSIAGKVPKSVWFLLAAFFFGLLFNIYKN